MDALTARELLAGERAAVTDRLRALERDLAGLVAAARDSNADDEHDPEGTTIAFERAQLTALLDRAREELADLDAAQTRVDAGEYGVCARCGGPIGDERLAARPAASTCVRCAARS